MKNQKNIKCAIIGCGYVADYYIESLTAYPWISICGVYDIESERKIHFSEFYSLHAYNTVEELLDDKRVEIVLNLTNPRSHYEVSHKCLSSGKHVYSEKPLAMNVDEAYDLLKLSKEKNIQISAAPSNLLGPAAQTLWKAIREGEIGEVKLVYAELDDGMVHKMPYQFWKSRSGISWPYKDEFEVGCTLEHAGYYLSWLAAIFGPAERVTAFSDCLIKNKVPNEKLEPDNTPDFSVAVIQYPDNVVARLSTTIVAPHDHGIRVIGEDGMLFVKESWDICSPVYVRKMKTIRRKTFLSPFKKRIQISNTPKVSIKRTGVQRMDFAAGVAELASSILEGRQSRLSPEFSLHITELALAIQNAKSGSVVEINSKFERVDPLAWAV